MESPKLPLAAALTADYRATLSIILRRGRLTALGSTIDIMETEKLRSNFTSHQVHTFCFAKEASSPFHGFSEAGLETVAIAKANFLSSAPLWVAEKRAGYISANTKLDTFLQTHEQIPVRMHARSWGGAGSTGGRWSPSLSANRTACYTFWAQTCIRVGQSLNEKDTKIRVAEMNYRCSDHSWQSPTKTLLRFLVKNEHDWPEPSEEKEEEKQISKVSFFKSSWFVFVIYQLCGTLTSPSVWTEANDILKESLWDRERQ